MDDRQELEDLRRMAELEARSGGSSDESMASAAPQQQDSAAPQQAEPSYLAVAGNAVAKGAASTADMFLNAPVNAYNVAKAGAVLAGDALGKDLRDDLTITPQPNLVEKGARAFGLISDDREPQTPGQRILDMAVQAGVSMAASPANSAMQFAKAGAMGLASGAAAGVTKELTDSPLAATAVGMAVPLLARGLPSKANAPILKNPVLKQTAQEGLDAGLVIPPSYIKPSVTTNRLQGFAGKAATKQEAQVRNVETIDNLARKAVGIPEGTPIKEGLKAVHDRANGPYMEVEKLRSSVNMPWFPRFHSTSLLEDLKAARNNATQTFKAYNVSQDTDTLKKAKAFRAEAESIEKDIQKVAEAAGRPKLVQQLKDARTLHAKAYDIERALNKADDHVSAAVLGKMYAKDKPLSGELLVIGKFAKAFPDAVRDASKIQSPGVSGIEAMAAGGLGAGGMALAGGPMGLLAAGVPLLRGPARSMLLSKGYQNRLLKEAPSLNPAMLQSLLAGRSTAETR